MSYTLYMFKRFLLFIFVVALFFFGIITFTAIGNKAVAMKYDSKESLVLTNTSLEQLQRPSECFNLLFDESNNNPYVFGWDGDTLYFKNGWNTAYSWNVQDKKTISVTLDNPQFLRQTTSSENCNPANRPNYETLDYPGGIDTIPCKKFQQGSTTVEIWPVAMGEILSLTNYMIAIEHADKKIIIDEARLVSDVVISENGKYVAITASNPAGFPNSFAATDVHVIELE